jgi:hypothetical protein
MKAIVCLALALAGCGASDFDMATQQCRDAPDVPAWDRCIDAYKARMAVRDSRQASQNEANAAMLLLGATAAMNGYSQARPTPITCYHTGMMSQCY